MLADLNCQQKGQPAFNLDTIGGRRMTLGLMCLGLAIIVAGSYMVGTVAVKEEWSARDAATVIFSAIAIAISCGTLLGSV